MRFDSLTALSNQYSELKELTWNNVYTRPDLQIKAMVLMYRDNARSFKNTKAMLDFTDAAYNGGVGGVQRERKVCKLTKGCDPDLWFGHVEKHCQKSKKPLYGKRNACDINREHVRNVRLIRRMKYIKYFGS